MDGPKGRMIYVSGREINALHDAYGYYQTLVESDASTAKQREVYRQLDTVIKKCYGIKNAKGGPRQ